MSDEVDIAEVESLDEFRQVIGVGVQIVATPRIGIDYAAEWKDVPLRFVDMVLARASTRRKSTANIGAHHEPG